MNVCNDLERIGDVFYQMSKTIEQKIENNGVAIPQEIAKGLGISPPQSFHVDSEKEGTTPMGLDNSNTSEPGSEKDDAKVEIEHENSRIEVDSQLLAGKENLASDDLGKKDRTQNYDNSAAYEEQFENDAQDAAPSDSGSEIPVSTNSGNGDTSIPSEKEENSSSAEVLEQKWERTLDSHFDSDNPRPTPSGLGDHESFESNEDESRTGAASCGSHGNESDSGTSPSNDVHAFQETCGVVFTSAEVVDLSGPRILREAPERVDDVVTMDLVTNLFAFIAKNSIMLTLKCLF